jgi:hypothetical protein
MRQKIKYFLKFLYFLLISLFAFLSYHNTIFLIGDTVLLSLIFFETNEKIFTVIFSAKLDKRIVHESGEYYIKYSPKMKKYYIYKDHIFYKYYLEDFDEWRIDNQKDLLTRVKGSLDERYKGILSKINRIKKQKKIMEEWDGYTSSDIKRDDKIKQVIN